MIRYATTQATQATQASSMADAAQRQQEAKHGLLAAASEHPLAVLGASSMSVANGRRGQDVRR